MTTVDWIIVIVAWSLLPAVLLLNIYFNKRQARRDAEFQKAIDEWLKSQVPR